MPTKRSPNITWGPRPESAIQFKVTLRHIQPPIWRRMVLSDNHALSHLHEVIQVAMGWHNCHLHSFQIGDVCYTSKDTSEMEDMDMEREDRIRLKELTVRPKQKFLYEYDFGDSWAHEIVVEKILPFDPQGQYPICLDGARAGPPEDCGGFPGYCDILEALKTPKKTEEQKELLEWLEDDYDPERFNLEAVNRKLGGKHK